MIVEWVMNLARLIISSIFALLDVLPNFPNSVVSVINSVFGLMFDAMPLVAIFIDINMIKILIPFTIAILNFDKIIKFVMFILKKIPILGIK